MYDRRMTINRQRPSRNAGAFLGPDILVPAPIYTLSDEIPAPEPEPEEEHEPAPDPPGIASRLRGTIDRLRHPTDPGDRAE